MNNDHVQCEINHMIRTLLIEHEGKLKPEEVTWLSVRLNKRIPQHERDTLIGMYDRMAEAGY